ncbi:MAG: ankyrin repeat domain-containing protein [Alphaproteobacteria bacterium]
MSAEEFNQAAAEKKIAKAAVRHQFDIIRRLVNGGASPDTDVPGVGSLLIYAVLQGQRTLAAFLLDKGASPNLADGAGDTPLMHAARQCQDEIVELLLEQGADPLAKNKDGTTAIGAATEGVKSMMNAFNDNEMMGISDIQSANSRFERIGLMLKEAKVEETKKREISSCHDGLDTDMPIRPPLKLKTPGT